MSTSIYDRIIQVHIDEEGTYDIDSDHVLMSLTFCSDKRLRQNVKQMPKINWNFNDQTNWDYFSDSQRNGLSTWNVNPRLFIDDTWTEWKHIINDTAE